MKAIWKYALEVTDRQVIAFPHGALFLKPVQLQHGKPVLWALVDPARSAQENEERVIVAHGTGHEIPEIFHGNYLGTVQLEGGALVLHYFEVPR